MKPRVLLDIDLLGHGSDFPGHKRGAHRVVNHLFEGLLRADGYDVTFTAGSHLAGAYDFLLAHGLDPATKLNYRCGQLSISRANRSIRRRIHDTMDDRRLAARAARRMLSEFGGILEVAQNQFPSGLSGIDIYHSPNARVPSHIRDNADITSFVTVNDFIPYTNPEYCGGKRDPGMEKLVLSLTEGIFAFCISEHVRSEALRVTRLRPENVFVTPLAADPSKFFREIEPSRISGIRMRYGIPEGRYFLALSAQDPHKNFAHIIDCFGALIGSGELADSNLVIAGPNPQRRSVLQEAIDRNPAVKNRIVVTGYLADEDLAAVYSGAVAFLFPSFAEGFGLPALEAMQCGTPVIASNTSSIPEIVGDAGILLPPQDRDGWCQAMLSVVRDSALSAELSQKALRRAGLFTWRRFMDATLLGYQKSMEK